MRFDDFNNPQPETKVSVKDFIAALKGRYRVAQMGGDRRFYQVGNTGKGGVIYLLDESLKGLGVTWERGKKEVATVYIWKHLNPAALPDLAIDIPVGGSADEIMDKLDQFIKNPHVGVSEAVDPSVATGDSTPLGSTDPNAKPPVDTTKVPPVDNTPAAAPPKTIGKVVDAPPTDDTQDLTKRLGRRGGLTLMGRNARGEFFIIPGMDKLLRQLESQLDTKIAEKSGGRTMEEQYAELEETVANVAGNKTRFKKALIITGAPSSGKTFRVMKTIHSLGLKAGDDYITKTGSVTDVALYRLLIEQLDGMIVFDDCDSIWETTNAANYLKGALNTDPVRTIAKDSGRTFDTANMSPQDRRSYLRAASRILRGRPIAGDIEKILPKMRSVTDHSADAYVDYLEDAKKFINSNPPNQIDFCGRVIFISNLDKSQLDQAVLSRCYHVDLNFSDDEMLDFISTVANKIERQDASDGVKSLSDEEIQEVLDFVRWKAAAGGFDSPINFRFIQGCFDARRTSPNWKNQISAM